MVNQVTRVLVDSRRQEGLSEKRLKNISEIEYNCALYAIKSKLGLDLPDFNDEVICKFNGFI